MVLSMDADRRRTQVRVALRKHYAANKEFYRLRNIQVRAAKSAFIRSERNKPCSDCGGSYPWYVMEFDHRNPEDKIKPISSMTNSGWSNIRAELDKCDVVCANCHSVRTHHRRHSSESPADVMEQ